MPRTKDELARAAAETAAWLDALDPDAADWDDPADLRAIADALQRVAQAEVDLADAVAAARKHERNWAEIGMALGITRQAARQRFDSPAEPG
jgi:hypothetical protein